MNDTDLTTDDEVLRVQAMTDGEKPVGKFSLRPITAESMAWMQTVGIFNEELGSLHRIAAYVMLHAKPKKELLPFVFSREKFWPAVSDWIEANTSHHTDLAPYDAEFDAAWSRYSAATTIAAHPSDPQPGGIKN